ncbi:LPS assembly lipoprotein LptE [Candidatus Omnitrophota bacterium]
MRLITFLLLSILLVTAGGCGYSTSSLLPPELDSIHVNNFLNKIDPTEVVSNKRPVYSYRAGLETDVTRAVIDAFIFDRHLGINTEKKASMLLEGELTSFQQFPLSYDKSDSVVEFRVEILVNMKLYNNLTGDLMWTENSFMGWSSYNVSGPNAKTESEAVTAAVKDLAQRIVERTVEAW